MDTLNSVTKAVVWGLCVLVMIVCILLAGTVGWFAMAARVSPNVAAEAQDTLANVKETVEVIETLRSYSDEKFRDEDRAEKLKAEHAIGNAVTLLEKKVGPYCEIAPCIKWYDDKYKFFDSLSSKQEQWAGDLPRMLKVLPVPGGRPVVDAAIARRAVI